MQHLFDIEIATKYGVDNAIFLKNIAHWVWENQAKKTNFHEDRTWTYNTLDDFVGIFPYWSRRQIERIINNCIREDLLIKGCFNKRKSDRTGWYTLSDIGHKLFNIPIKPQCLSISPNGEMDFTERGNGFHQTVTALPYNKPDNKPDIKSIGVKKRTPATNFPDDFKFTEEQQQICTEFNLDINFQLRKYKSWYKGKRKSDWSNKFTSWLLTAVEHKSNKSGTNVNDKLQSRNIMFDSCKESLRELREETNSSGYPLISQMG